MGSVRDFMVQHYRHFNAATVVDAAREWETLLEKGGRMLLTIAGAMSTAELGIVIAELIRRDMVHAISCTGANLEEDVFNLVAHNSYTRIPDYRNLTPEDELALLNQGLNRVTDTCIPEEEAMRRVEAKMLKSWQKAEEDGESLTPAQHFFRVIKSGALAEHYEIDAKDSWMVAAAHKDLPIFVPGWEDSTLGNMFVASKLKGLLQGYSAITPGTAQMEHLVRWYRETSGAHPVGFFQIGGGIAGDFAICCVPLIEQDLKQRVNYWSYFAQISDSTTSFGSYSGAPPNEKITWGKLEPGTPNFVIESDATIVFPLIAAYLLNR